MQSSDSPVSSYSITKFEQRTWLLQKFTALLYICYILVII